MPCSAMTAGRHNRDERVSRTAFVDESVRGREGVYVLAAAVLDEFDQNRARDRVGTLALRGRLPFHWRLELPRRRMAAVQVVAELAMLHVVVVGFSFQPARQERARRKCLQELLFRLEAEGVEHVLLESRNAIQDHRDRTVVDGFRARRIITAKLRVDHALPSVEPLLWISDIVAGAVSAAEADEHRYRARLDPVIAEYRVRLD